MGWTWVPRFEMYARLGKRDLAMLGALWQGVRIYNWISSTRKKYHEGSLAPDLTRALEGIPGWAWQGARIGRAGDA